MARHPGWTRRLFAEGDLEAIAAAVARAERETSGEIRVHLDRRLPRGPRRAPRDALERAWEVFGHLGMHRTAERSGVLIYLAVEDRRLAIAGDAGVHARVGDGYWQRVRDGLVEKLRAGAPREALLTAVGEVASVLSVHFPRRPDDRNELSDQVSAG
jgi:uncharacterized membrane protein